MTEAKKEVKPGYYFKIIRKGEFPEFMDKLKEASKKEENKKDDKKCIESSLSGSKEDLQGCALEIFSFDKESSAEFLDVTQEKIENGSYRSSLNINVKEEADCKMLEETFNKFLLPILEQNPHLKDKIEFNFRSKGKQCSFDAVAKDGKLVKALLDSGINLPKIFDKNAEPAANLVKICSVIFSIKSESESVYLIKMTEAKKEVKPMTEAKKEVKPMTEAKKEVKPGYYFKIIPKEEFPKFMDRLKEALKKEENKKGDKKCIEFSLSGSKEDLQGCALEIFSFDKTRCAEFLDVTQAHIKDSLYCASLNINVKEEADCEKLKLVFEQSKPMLANIPHLKDKVEFNFRSKGKQCSFDAVGKDGKLVKAILDLGISFSDYHKFNFALKSGVNLAEIFDKNADPAANLVKICSVIFSIKSESENVRYLCTALGEALKDVKLNDEKIQKKFDKVVGYINFINSFIGCKLKLEYDANVLAGEGTKEAEKMSGGSEGLKKAVTGYQQMVMGMVEGLIVPMIGQFGMIETAKVLDLDYISISLGVPKYENGYAISLKLPGLTKVLEKILNAPEPQKQTDNKK